MNTVDGYRKTQFRLFKIPEEANFIVFVPELGRIYRVPREAGVALSDFVVDDNASSVANEEETPKDGNHFTSVVLAVTDDCNLRCWYCYGDFGAPRKKEESKTMELEVAKAAIDHVLRCALSNHKRKINVGFFGGEPTLAWDCLREMVGYARTVAASHGIVSKISITTNGCMEVSQADWLAQHVDSVSVSFDGFASIQNFQRSGSFDTVFTSSKRIYALLREKMSLRATVTEHSVRFFPQIVEFFGENFPGCTQKYEPLFPMGRGSCADRSHLSSLNATFFEKFVESIPIAKRYHAKLKTSVLRLSAHSHATFCGASGNNFLVVPNGDVVSCNRMIGDGINAATDFFNIGSFDKKEKRFVFNEAKIKNSNILSFKNIPECENCFAQFSCKGDCPANKSVMCPSGFWFEKSYRCEEVKVFIRRILSYVLDNGREGLFI